MHSLPNRAVGDRAATPLRVRRLGLRDYHDAVALQERAAGRVAAGAPDELLLVTHPPVITLGRGARAEQVLLDADELARRGIPLIPTDRGGGATFHGPGQILGYPIVSLRRRGLGVRCYLRALEAALVALLRGHRIAAFPRSGLTGVWSAAGKVAAIGVAVRQGVTRHGFALNVDDDLRSFGYIVPCGLTEPVTSLRRLGWTGERGALIRDLSVAVDAALDAATRATDPAPTVTYGGGREGRAFAGVARSSPEASPPNAPRLALVKPTNRRSTGALR